MRSVCVIRAAMSLAAILVVVAGAMADTFGAGANQFSLAFVPISGATNPTSGIPAGITFTFTGVANDYRIGTYDVTNDQWNKFTASLGVPVTGSDGGYKYSSFWTGANVPVNCVSWYEAAQFVNWLNTSTGHQAAYKFTGTQGTGNYTFAAWSPSDVGYNPSDPYRNSNAFYYLPTEDEWVKAAYWNGTSLQTYATKPGDTLYQGNGSNGGWNYNNPYPGDKPWPVGSGSQELNGTYDMMGNVYQWMESPLYSGDYGTASNRGLRGGTCASYGSSDLASSARGGTNPASESGTFGFRVASQVPEPCSLALLTMGGLVLLKRKRN